MTRIFKAFAALTLVFSLSSVDALAGDDGAISFDKLGSATLDKGFDDLAALNDKLVESKTKLADIKAKVEAAKDDATVLKTAQTDLNTLVESLKTIPDSATAAVKSLNDGKSAGLKEVKGMFAKAKAGKNFVTNIAKAPKIGTNAAALLKEAQDTLTEVGKSAEAAAKNAASAAEGAAEGAVDAAKDAAKEAAK